jgi:hypothetical protein
VEVAPVRITSPPVPVEAGSVVVIHGWVRVPAPITGSIDGLKIVDSLAGEPLAERIDRTSDWQPFALHRTVPRSGRMRVTFELSGWGEAWIDDVAIQALEPAGLRAAGRDRAPAPWRLPPTNRLY